jgi:hypothetical protein
MPFWYRRNAGTVNQSLLLDISSALAERSSLTEGTGHYFIHPQDARDILRREHIRGLFSNLSWYEEDQRTYLYQNLSLILCILISMNWTEWGEFQSYFFMPGHGLRYARYTDEHLPIPKTRWIGSIPPNFADRFNEYQYRFLPIIIEENSHLKFDAAWRLPILTREPLQDVQGAQGVVEKISVQRGFLLSVNHRSNQVVRHIFYKPLSSRSLTLVIARAYGLQTFQNQHGCWYTELRDGTEDPTPFQTADPEQ